MMPLIATPVVVVVKLVVSIVVPLNVSVAVAIANVVVFAAAANDALTSAIWHLARCKTSKQTHTHTHSPTR